MTEDLPGWKRWIAHGPVHPADAHLYIVEADWVPPNVVLIGDTDIIRRIHLTAVLTRKPIPVPPVDGPIHVARRRQGGSGEGRVRYEGRVLIVPPSLHTPEVKAIAAEHDVSVDPSPHLPEGTVYLFDLDRIAEEINRPIDFFSYYPDPPPPWYQRHFPPWINERFI